MGAPGRRALPALDSRWSEERREAFQAELWPFYRDHLRRYTMDESSSLPVELAGELLESLLFCIKLGHEEAGPEGQPEGPEALYRRGVEVLERILDRTKQLYQAALRTKIDTGNLPYRDTLEGISTFFRRYDYRFFARDIPCDITYPLCIEIDGLWGVLFIREYLHRVLLENQFCAAFSPALLGALWAAVCPDPAEYLINLYEPAAYGALGLELLGADPAPLSVAPRQREELIRAWEGSGPGEMAWRVQRAAETLGRRLDGSGSLCRYLEKTATKLSHTVEVSLPRNDLSHIFVTL